MSYSRFFTVMVRTWLKGSTPEYNPSVLDYMPKKGLIGYTTNNPRLSFLLLSEPAHRFGFQVKDFSTIDSSLNFKEKSYLAGYEQYKHSFDSMYSESNIDSGDVFNSKTVITHQFPKTIEEAKNLEEEDGGVNLFIHLEFDEGVNHQWKENSNLKMLKCSICGKVKPNTPELSSANNDQLTAYENQMIGQETNCNLESIMCNWEECKMDEENNRVEDLTDLHSYFDSKGLLMRFKVDNNTSLNRARVELLKNMAATFKL